ncbi:MAG: CHASE2 domain-containing protein, partial [Alphaproteobacteria bacterium]|nr:CHASE2 domain-containing protein [Alphaproteobacteria bacterium]
MQFSAGHFPSTMRDDTFQPPPDANNDEQSSVGRRFLSALARPFRAINWRNLTSGAWLWRWFRQSWVLSGRLTMLLLLIGVVALRFDEPEWAQRLRAQTFDLYQRAKPRPFVENGPVVIVDMDEKSISELGQFPWDRTIFGDMVTKLTEMGVTVIGFDIFFSEEDRTSLPIIAKTARGLDEGTVAKLKSAQTNDEYFAEAIKKSGVVVLGSTFGESNLTASDAKVPTSFSIRNADPADFVENHEYVLRPFPILEAAAAGRGIFSVSENRIDGIVRDVPMVMKIRRYSSRGTSGLSPEESQLEGLLPSLTLEMLRVALKVRTILINTDPITGVESIYLRPRGTRDNILISTDQKARVWTYFTPHSEYKKNYVSASDIIAGRVDPARVAGKYVLIGTSAQGLRDVRASPLDKVLPGVEVHANIIENVLFNQRLKRVPTADGFEVVVTIIGALIIIIITPMVGARVGALTVLAMSGAFIGYSWNAFDTRLELYDPVFPTAVIVLFYMFLTYAAFSSTEAQKRQVRAAFGQYLSPDLVETLAEDPSKLKLGGENREMTFMFSDIRGFTGLSEIFDAQGLTKLINRLLTPMTDEILKNRGTIDKYMGDCIMAFWNAPLDVPNHANLACKSALGMIQAVKDLNATLEAEAKAEGRPHRVLAVGVGVNSGIACVGNMGSTQRFDYSVLGDAVNLASRLEGQSKTYHVTAVLGEHTAAQVSGYAILELDLIKVKGKATAVRIFTLMGDQQLHDDPDFVAHKVKHDAMLAAYRAQQWDETDRLADECKVSPLIGKGLTTEMPGFYDMYRERVADFR